MSNYLVPDLKLSQRSGYARGQDSQELILHAAHRLLVEHGYGALTLRRIATECGLNVGNLNYYFRSKDELVWALLDAIIGAYEGAFEAISHEAGASVEQRFESVIRLILEDITTKKTTRIFPELWALTNHDPDLMVRVDEMYQRARVVINELIAELNPALGKDERETLALFISASMEGMTVFAGHEKPWRSRMPWIQNIAARSFINLVKDLKPGEMGTPLNELDHPPNMVSSSGPALQRSRVPRSDKKPGQPRKK